MKRRETLQAKDEQRSPRTLYAWDFLIGVQDLTRQGALRFRRPGTEAFSWRREGGSLWIGKFPARDDDRYIGA
jgi:hypothetical protein